VTHDVQVLDETELREAYAQFAATIHFGPGDDASWSRSAALYEPDRTIGIRDGGALVATAAAFPARMAVPGGAALPMAAVTRVGVRPDHTRRGMLTAMMRAQLADVVERGEPVATLRSSQARIYGRFGYGVATRGRSVRVRRSGSGWRESAPRGGHVRVLGRDEAGTVLPMVHERIALRRPGGMTRPPGWWAQNLAPMAGPDAVLVAVHTGEDGDDGFAVAGIGSGEDWERRPLELHDLHAADVAAAAGLWRFLLEVDLVGCVEGGLRPVDEPLELLLSDPRDCTVSAQGDEAWLRLVDVAAALGARTWGEAQPVLLSVHDALLPANTGVYRIGSDGVERVTCPPGVHPDLECAVDGLAMAHLGDRSPSELVAAGWWRAPDTAALHRADRLFAGSVLPWCGTFF